MKSADDARASGPPIKPQSRPRRERFAAEVATVERQKPLQRRVLELLAETELAPKDVAERLGSNPQSISRILSRMRREGLVEYGEVPGDKRGKRYFLTAVGERSLSRHRAYGKPPASLPAASDEARTRFFYSGLDEAVEIRRKSNDLEGAATRISLLLRQARQQGDGMLVVECIHELATTLRQCRAPDQALALLGELDEISLGKLGEPLDDPTLVMPAIAHRAYGLGRLEDRAGEEMLRRAGHLVEAANFYARLAAAPAHLDKERWIGRQAWSSVALARNLRARSDFEAALTEAAKAIALFDQIEDDYGRSNALYSVGVCMRLLGAFDDALVWLDKAHELAEANSFARFQAESLLQKGEVHRCCGNFSAAEEMLRESLGRSRQMKLEITGAFAQSALGAVAFHQQDLSLADEELRSARKAFESLRNREGIALTLRRKAAVLRRLLAEKSRSIDPHELLHTIRFSRACYRELASPPGVAVCDIEQARMQRMRGGNGAEIIDRLIDLLDNRPDERTVVELDLWVPPVLREFALETENEHLVERSQGLVEAGRQKLRTNAELGLRKAVRAAGGGRGADTKPTVEVVLGAPFVEAEADEMGGEVRQRGNQTTEFALA